MPQFRARPSAISARRRRRESASLRPWFSAGVSGRRSPRPNTL